MKLSRLYRISESPPMGVPHSEEVTVPLADREAVEAAAARSGASATVIDQSEGEALIVISGSRSAVRQTIDELGDVATSIAF